MFVVFKYCVIENLFYSSVSINLIRRLVLLLSVVSVRTVLAVEVLLYEQWVHGGVWIHAERDERHLCHLLGYHCVIDSLVSILTPCERTVVLHQYAWSVNGVDIVLLESVNDDYTCIVLILGHHILCHCIGARNAVVEIVCVGSTDVRDVQSCLSPGCSVGRVGVNHAAQFWECTV